MKTPNNHKKGFASMNVEQRKEIASKGGIAISKNKIHMSEIGRKGGSAPHKNRIGIKS